MTSKGTSTGSNMVRGRGNDNKGGEVAKKIQPKRVLLSVRLGIAEDYQTSAHGSMDDNALDFSDWNNNNFKQLYKELKTFFTGKGAYTVVGGLTTKKFELPTKKQGRGDNAGTESSEYLPDLIVFDTEDFRAALEYLHGTHAPSEASKGGAKVAKAAIDLDDLENMSMEQFEHYAALTQERFKAQEAFGEKMKGHTRNKTVKAKTPDPVEENEVEENEVDILDSEPEVKAVKVNPSVKPKIKTPR